MKLLRSNEQILKIKNSPTLSFLGVDFQEINLASCNMESVTQAFISVNDHKFPNDEFPILYCSILFPLKISRFGSNIKLLTVMYLETSSQSVGSLIKT